MAVQATVDEFLLKYPDHQEQEPGVISARLTEARAFIVGYCPKLTTIEADTDGLEAIKQAEMMLAFESLAGSPAISGSSRSIEAGETEGNRARLLLDTWNKWGKNQTSLHREQITTAPSFTPDRPETWSIETYDTGDTST